MDEIEKQAASKRWLKLYGIYLLVFLVFAVGQLWFLFLSGDDTNLRLWSIGLLLLVIGINATLVLAFQPSKSEWARLIKGAGFVSSWILTVGSLIGFVFNWTGQWGSWQGMASRLGFGGFLYFMVALVTWLLSAWLAVKLYQLIMLKLGETLIEKYLQKSGKRSFRALLMRQK